MIIKSFRAQNFRNIEECSLEFDEKVNILLGENAQGKTNAVEGIYLFARGKSFRRGDEKDLARFGAEGFSLSICYEDKYGENKLDYAVFGKERRRNQGGDNVDNIIVEAYLKNLADAGAFVFEIGYDQGLLIKELAQNAGFECEVRRDYGSNDRLAILKKSKL